MKKTWGKGITLVGVIALVVMLGIVAFVLYRLTLGPRETKHQDSCGNRMACIGNGMLQYSGLSNESAVMLPMIADPNGTGRNPSAKIENIAGTDDPNLPVEELGGKGNINAMQNIWPLIYRGVCQENYFRCSMDEGYKQRQTIASGVDGGKYKRYGWTEMNQFSYGVQWCYPDANNKNPCDPVSANMDEKAVIMAERNPGGAVSENGTKIKPSNHPNDGMNVLYRDGHVEFYPKTTDSKAGKDGDDIYVNNAGIIGPPTARPDVKGSEAFDTIIVPAYPNDPTTGRGE